MRRTKTSSKQTDNIEALSERLESLQITNEALEKIYKQSDKEIFTTSAPAPAITNNNRQTVMPKSIVPDPG